MNLRYLILTTDADNYLHKNEDMLIWINSTAAHAFGKWWSDFERKHLSGFYMMENHRSPCTVQIRENKDQKTPYSNKF